LQANLEGGELRITLCTGSAAEDKEATVVLDRIAGLEGGEDDGKMGWVQDGVVEE